MLHVDAGVIISSARIGSLLFPASSFRSAGPMVVAWLATRPIAHSYFIALAMLPFIYRGNRCARSSFFL